MKKLYLSFAVALVVTLLPSSATGQSDIPNVTTLSNKDIVVMVDRKVDSEAIIEIIKTSPCTFDTFPPLLLEMKRRGVPEEVLQAMVEAPYGPSPESRESRDDLAEGGPIYHFAEQLTKMGVISPVNGGRRFQPSRRARASRTRRQQ